MFLEGNIEDSCSSMFFFELFDVGSFDFEAEIHSDWRSFDIVSLFWLGYIDAIDITFFCFHFVFLGDGLLDSHHGLTGFIFGLFYSDFVESAHFDGL